MEIVTANPNSVPTTCKPAWRAAMRNAIRDPAVLCRMLELPESWAKPALAAAADFPLFAPLGFVAKMTPGDVDDPLLRQVLPVDHELQDRTGFSRDPLNEQDSSLTPGLLKKYAGRALLVATGACAIHCRYCFRRHFPYAEGSTRNLQWRAALEAIAADSTIEEVLLSGGDPLTLSDSVLSNLVTEIEAIPHVARLRIHTRLPVVIPERVDELLLGWIERTRLSVVTVLHANHAAEICDEVAGACEQLRRAGSMLLNQSVLLRRVNDDVDTQESLCRRLANIGVTPYYLHQMDRVAGAAHFVTDCEVGIRIIRELRKRLPGYATPRFVQELPGEAHKTVLE